MRLLLTSLAFSLALLAFPAPAHAGFRCKLSSLISKLPLIGSGEGENSHSACVAGCALLGQATGE